jgi:hypothetical protein
MNKRRIALFAALLAGGLAIGIGQTAYADNNPQLGRWYELYPPYFNPGAPKCLDVPSGKSDTGLVLQVFHCHGYDSNGAPQRWAFRRDGKDLAGNDKFEIMNLASRECLNVANSSGATGTLAVQDFCLQSDRGEWVLHPTPNVGPYFGLSNVKFPNQCLATSNSSGADHTRVEISDCGYTNQNDPNWIRGVWSLG